MKIYIHVLYKFSCLYEWLIVVNCLELGLNKKQTKLVVLFFCKKNCSKGLLHGMGN